MIESLDLDIDKIPLARLAFFRERLRHHFHQLILKKFLALQDGRSPEFTKKKLADRIHRRPEVITRLLGSAGNLTLDTLSDLLLGMGAIPEAQVVDLVSKLQEPEFSPKKMEHIETPSLYSATLVRPLTAPQNGGAATLR